MGRHALFVKFCFEPDTVDRIQYGKKKCGRPRPNWLRYFKKYLYEHVLRVRFYNSTDEDARFFTARGQSDLTLAPCLLHILTPTALLNRKELERYVRKLCAIMLRTQSSLLRLIPFNLSRSYPCHLFPEPHLQYE